MAPQEVHLRALLGGSGMTNLYVTLGVNPTATAAEIKAAYRSLAQKHHPDKDGGDKEAFQAIQQAYDTLSDPEKRAQYDATGEVPAPGSSLRDEAIGLISQALDLLLQKYNPDTSDMLTNLRDVVKAEKKNAEEAAEKYRKRQEKAERAAKRVAVREGHTGVLPMILAHLQTQFEPLLAQGARFIARCDLALELLDDHTYSWEEETIADAQSRSQADALNQAVWSFLNKR